MIARRAETDNRSRREKSIRCTGACRPWHRHRRRLYLEQCEPRELLAVFTVTSALDTGAAGELRWAVNSANANPGPDTINFSVPQVQLALGELAVTGPVAIDGSSSVPVLVQIAASPNSRIFNVDDGNPLTNFLVTMKQLELQQGNVSLFPVVGEGGAILNRERLEIESSLVSHNKAVAGGAIANHGNLQLLGVDVTNNLATGLGGGAVWNAPGATFASNSSGIRSNEALNGLGGGILNDGAQLTVFGDSASVNGNTANQGGGGIAVINGGSATLQSGTIASNDSPLGGGLLVDNLGSSLTANAAVNIHSNTAANGGGLAVRNQAAVDLRGTLVTGNLAGLDGGGILVQTATADMAGVEISSNRAGSAVTNGRGGGLFADLNATVSLVGSIVSYNGATAVPTTIDRGGGIFAGGGVSLVIESSRVSGNNARQGGGLYVTRNNAAGLNRPQVMLSNTILEGNVANSSGGGLFSGPGVDLTLDCATVSGNQAIVSGGGLYLNGPSSANTIDAELLASTIVGNSAQGNGGGIVARLGVDLSIVNSIVSENNARQRGGGLYLVGPGNATTVNQRTTIQLSLVSGNRAATPAGPYVAGRSGGGIWAGNGAALEVSTTTIQGNQSGGTGGGIAVAETRQFVLADSTVSGNKALEGAGISIAQADATLLQNTFYANVANRDGGGVLVRSSMNNRVSIKHSTLSLNAAALTGAGHGGGIFVGYGPGNPPNVDLDHTIVSGNLGAPLGGFDEVYDGGVSAGISQVAARFSLLRDNAGTGFAPGNPDANGNLIGTPAAPIDAQLGPLGNFGGPTLTMVPGNASPAIDAGDPLFTGPPPGDQRTLPYKRVARMRIDMGAVEVQPPPPDPDFNNDGVADCTDANALSVAIFNGGNNPAFDLTGDGLVNRADMVKWLDDAPDINGIAITAYQPGDANLDGLVDGQDFIIWNLFKFSAAVGWCVGDFNIDGFVDGQDFILWNVNKFKPAPTPTGCGLFRNTGSAGRDAAHEAASWRPQYPNTDVEQPRDAVFADLPADETVQFLPTLSAGGASSHSPTGKLFGAESKWHELLSTVFEADDDAQE